MKRIHVPRIDARYWAAITLASIFGTNLGDLYAHESGLGIGLGLVVLAAIVVVAMLVERMENMAHEVWYWFAIIIIRTGATNIADYLAFRVRVPLLVLTLGLAALIALFGWLSVRSANEGTKADSSLPSTNASYWVAMLGAGVFGTVLGDICSHWVGKGAASLGLDLLLALALFARSRASAKTVALYWLTVAVARTAGTAMGDWLAETKELHIGLPLSTLITGIAFSATLLLWRSSGATGRMQEA